MSSTKAGTKVVGYVLFTDGTWEKYSCPVNPGVTDESLVHRAFRARAKAKAEPRGAKIARVFTMHVRHSHETLQEEGRP